MDNAAWLAVGAFLGTTVVGILVALVNVKLAERIKAANQKGLEDVKTANQQGIERLKDDLARSSRLQERRVEVLAELYRRLVVAERALRTALDPLGSGPSGEAAVVARAAGNDLAEYFQAHEVWLDESLRASIEKLVGEIHRAWGQFNSDRGTSPAAQDGWYEAWRRMSSDNVAAIKAEIRSAVRAMLGPAPSLTPTEVVRR